MYRAIGRITIIAGILATFIAHAATTDNPVGLITGMYSYTDYGTGDVVITVQTPPPACQHGFWIRMTDPGAKTVFAQVLAAYHASTPLRMGGYDNSLWPGSTGTYCRVYFVGPTY